MGIVGRLLLILFLCLSLFGLALGGGRVGGHIEKIYNFGDSIWDTGNLVVEGTPPFFEPIKQMPYGKSIGEPTGRCSDGLLMIDYIANRFNLPSLEPYLKKKKKSSFTQGVNFAVAGATALDNTYFQKKGFSNPFTNSSLKVQLNWFKDHIKSTHQCPPRQKVCVPNFDHSLFLLGEIGGNDYNYAFMGGKSVDEVVTYIHDVIEAIVDGAEELIKYGANKIIIPGNFPIECVPAYLTMFDVLTSATPIPNAYDQRGCVKAFNAFSVAHNLKLQEAIVKLRKAHPKVTIIYADYYNAYLNLLDNVAVYGFEKETRLQACCGGGGKYNFNPSKQCSADSETSLCKNPSQYLSWDGIHLTQNAYMNMGRELMNSIIPKLSLV